MRSVLRGTIVAALAASLSGCLYDYLYTCACARGARTLVVVVPSSTDGHVGAVVVNPGANGVVVNSAYGAAQAFQDGSVERTQLAKADINTQFAAARDARPDPPVSFLLYFNVGTDEFSTESQPAVDGIFKEIRRRVAAEITVIGHTDRVGNRNDNDALSKQRAERVREELIKLGVQREVIKSAGRGEREPIVKTADEIDEPRNRRVEISVR